MKKGLTITIIICMFLFLSGGILLIIGLANGGKLLFNIDYRNKKVETAKDLKIVTGEETVDSFSSIDLDVHAAEVRIVEGGGYNVKYAMYEGDIPRISVEDNKLTIKTINDGEGYVSFDLLGFAKQEEKTPYIEITVPAGTEFDDVRMKTNAGDINLDGYVIDALDIEANAGSIDLKNMTIDSFDADVNCGGIDISSSEIGTLTTKQNMGSLAVDDTRIYSADVDTDAGSVMMKLIGEEADYHIDVDVNAGSFQLNGETKDSSYNANSDKEMSIEVDASAGSVMIDF